tara:strand:+ start:4155 stop:4508 length:354 start_codon:yes stop_codon:yes gene_type:complete
MTRIIPVNDVGVIGGDMLKSNEQLEIRIKKKMCSKLKLMQYMWIKPHRMSDEEIDSMRDRQLITTYKASEILWSNYDHKPKAPDLCTKCGLETSTWEYQDQDGKWCNDMCKECKEDE